jgi:hypothetical protein
MVGDDFLAAVRRKCEPAEVAFLQGFASIVRPFLWLAGILAGLLGGLWLLIAIIKWMWMNS